VTGLFVERARTADLEDLLALEERAYSHPWTRRNFEGELASPHAVVLVLRAGGGGLRGYCAFRVVAGEMHLMNLTVDPEVRRRGLGRFLLDLALDLAGRRGAEASFLEVRAGNREAAGLYRTAGFAEVGRRKDYYNRPREDALLLRRPLAGGLSGSAKEP